jgi:predicted CopG family antitoxin
MATKTLTITDDAYRLLRDKKLENESFSEEIRRLLSKRTTKTLNDFMGILSEGEGEKMLNDLNKIRKQQAAITKKRTQWM